MRKVLLIAVLAVASVMMYAQPRAIGGRLGAFNGVSYEHAIGEHNMIEVELGLSIDGYMNIFGKLKNVSINHLNSGGLNIQAACTYDWIDPFGATFPTMPKGEWHWYMGVGGAAGGGWRVTNWTVTQSTGVLTNYQRGWGFIAPAGRVGVEYDFWFPLQLSLDWRPTVGLAMMDIEDQYNDGIHAGVYWEVTSVSLGVRYKF